MSVNKRLALSTLFCVVVLGIASATVFVKKTAAAYCGVCEPLDGVPGVLQRVGFIPEGNCKHRVKNKRCIAQQCEVSGRKGFCKTRVIKKDKDGDHDGDDQRFVCFCEPYKVSH